LLPCTNRRRGSKCSGNNKETEKITITMVHVVPPGSGVHSESSAKGSMR
jgi:hypothetical protein